MGQYLIDNNVISSYFSGLLNAQSTGFISDIIDQVPNISVITEIEALTWVNPDKKKEQIVREFIQDSKILTISPEIVQHCVTLRRSRKIKTPDAIIAATAITHDLILVTSDKDFNNIPGLQLIDPFSM